MKLHGPDHWTWLGLRRVNCGVVSRFEGTFYDRGRPFSGCLYPILIEGLIEEELLDVSAPDESGWQRVVLSEAGRAEYRALCRRQRRKDPQDQVPGTAPESGTTQTPAGHQSSESPSRATVRFAGPSL
ncbi:MAG TPA: hypothetical protein VFQ77_14155 [Pseudonocardiaceae bacterium]|nr:hypothetical protein [Pseudonocardiaceae bacterium]